MSLLPLGLISQGGGAGGGGAAFELISTQILTGTSSTVSFTSIPATYTHLQLRIVGKYSAASTTGFSGLQFNSDTTTNYSWHQLTGDAASVASSGATTTTSAGFIYLNANDIGASSSSANIIDILDYANANKYKTTRMLGGRANNTALGGQQIQLVSGNWRSTSAITRIDLPVLDGTSYSIGSRFSLYGIRGA